MSKIEIAIGILCTGITIMLQDSPEIIKSNFGKWLEHFGITIPIWIHSQWFYNCMMSACFLWLVVSTINYFRPKTQPIIPIKIEKVVDYLTTKSLWSEQQYRKYNFRDFSKGEYPLEEYPLEEIVDKARLGLITIKGSIPNTVTAKEIDKDYWKDATLGYSGSYLCTKCKDINRRFDFITYDSLEITSPDIKIIWKPSSRLDRFYSRLLFFLKSKIYYPIKSKLFPTKPPASY